MLCIGLAVAFNMDVILATMSVGIVLINLAPRRSKQLFEVIRSFSTPIYIIFFVLVGARLSLGNMPLWLVITSYSIHYTKLYDLFRPNEGVLSVEQLRNKATDFSHPDQPHKRGPKTQPNDMKTKPNSAWRP